AQLLLRIASCLPRGIDLQFLAALAERPVEETAAALWSAIAEGLLMPVGMPFTPDGGSCPSDESGNLVAVYRFVHDRVRDAAYSLLTGPERERLHLKIGQRLAADTPDGESDARIFEVVEQLNLSVGLLTRPSEQLWLASLNARAARRARTSSAFGPA